MCNLYDIGPAPNNERFKWEALLREALGEITYVAPKKPGLVVRMIDGEFSPALMRWGFHRPWSPCINNARDDKLTGRTWSKSWNERRCILPVRRFYEWSGQKGSKTKHAIQADPDHWFWIAGIWEDNPQPQAGLSYSMLTTNANQQMKAIHDRMPVILGADTLEEFLTAEEPPIDLVKPYDGDLLFQPPAPEPDLL